MVMIPSWFLSNSALLADIKSFSLICSTYCDDRVNGAKQPWGPNPSDLAQKVTTPNEAVYATAVGKLTTAPVTFREICSD